MTTDQLSLFTDTKLARQERERPLEMSEAFLTEWKSRIVNHQQEISNHPPAQQTSLFEQSDRFDPDRVDPFGLRSYQPFEFYRFPEIGEANCLYFVIDFAQPLLLYIGETQQTPKKRWMSHYCRDYTANYLELHHRHKLNVAVNIGFWWDTPTDRKARQAMELALIKKWQPPFNKECWSLYGQPFKKN